MLHDLGIELADIGFKGSPVDREHRSHNYGAMYNPQYGSQQKVSGRQADAAHAEGVVQNALAEHAKQASAWNLSCDVLCPSHIATIESEFCLELKISDEPCRKPGREEVVESQTVGDALTQHAYEAWVAVANQVSSKEIGNN